MLWEELSITLDTDKLMVDNAGACIVNNDQMKIECRDTILSCIYSGGTLFCTAPTELKKCRFHRIRRSTGIVVTGSNGTETFISREGSMVCLILCCTKLSNVLFYFSDVLFYYRLSVDRDYLTELK
jgi:hypothetical protein